MLGLYRQGEGKKKAMDTEISGIIHVFRYAVSHNHNCPHHMSSCWNVCSWLAVIVDQLAATSYPWCTIINSISTSYWIYHWVQAALVGTTKKKKPKTNKQWRVRWKSGPVLTTDQLFFWPNMSYQARLQLVHCLDCFVYLEYGLTLPTTPSMSIQK